MKKVLGMISISIIILLFSILFIFYRRTINQINENYRCSFLKPVSGSEIKDQIEIEGKVSDKSIRHIFLQLDEGNWMKVPTVEEKWSHNLNTKNLNNGQHSFAVKIRKFGKETEPVKITVFINND